jgi:hypothetical protein
VGSNPTLCTILSGFYKIHGLGVVVTEGLVQNSQGLVTKNKVTPKTLPDLGAHNTI